MSHTTFRSPLADRYASRAMLELWSLQTRHGLWRRLWLALAHGMGHRTLETFGTAKYCVDGPLDLS